MYLLIKLRSSPVDMLGLKECLAMMAEKFAEVERVDVVDTAPDQVKIGGT